MSLFGNRDIFERKNTEYNSIIEGYKACLSKYECLIREHGEQAKEYEEKIKFCDTPTVSQEEQVKEYREQIKEHEEQVKEYRGQLKEYDNNLQRFENQLEIHAEVIQGYDIALKRYGADLAEQEKKLAQYHVVDDSNKKIVEEMADKLMLKSLENRNQIITKLEGYLDSSERHNKSLRKSIAFLMLFNLITLAIGIFMSFCVFSAFV